ncbi:hypothetical protein HDV05_008547, partial [Chytridiales sp. JEL 0842]
MSPVAILPLPTLQDTHKMKLNFSLPSAIDLDLDLNEESPNNLLISDQASALSDTVAVEDEECVWDDDELHSTEDSLLGRTIVRFGLDVVHTPDDNTSPSVLVVTGHHKPTEVARWIHSQSYSWVEWFNARSTEKLEESYTDFVHHLLSGHSDAENWAFQQDFDKVVERCSATLNNARTLRGGGRKKNRSCSFGSSFSEPIQRKTTSDALPRPRMLSVSSTFAGTGLERRPTLQNEKSRHPLIVLDGLNESSLTLSLRIVNAHKLSPFILLVDDETIRPQILETLRKEMRMEVECVDLSEFTKAEALGLLSKGVVKEGMGTMDLIKLVQKVGTDPLQLSLSIGYMATNTNVKADEYLISTLTPLDVTLEFVLAQTTSGKALFTTLALASLMESGPFAYTDLCRACLELLPDPDNVHESRKRHTSLDKCSTSVDTALSIIRGRGVEVEGRVRTILNEMLYILERLHLVQVTRCGDTFEYVSVPAAVREVVLEKIQSTSSYQQVFFDTLALDPNDALFSASHTGPTQLVQLLLTHPQTLNESIAINGITPLHICSIAGTPSIATLLLPTLPNINT